MPIETKDFIEEVYHLSLYDRKYRVPAEEDQPVLAKLAIDELNTLIQEYKNKLPFATPMNKTIAREENKYGIIEGVNLSEVSKVHVRHEGILRSLKFCDIDDFLNKISVSDCALVPSIYTLVPSKSELWIFPAYASTYIVWTYDFPTFEVQYTVGDNTVNTLPEVLEDESITVDFIPKELPYGDNVVFWKFMTLKLAQRFSELHGDTLNSARLRTLAELERNLLHKKEIRTLCQPLPTILSDTWI